MGIPPISDLEAKVIASRDRSFLEEKFLLKELSGRKIELDKVVEPSLQPESSAAQKDVFIRFGFELISLKLFHISVAAPHF